MRQFNFQTNVTMLSKFLITDQVLKATVNTFNNDLCPYEAPEGATEACQKNVTAVWPLMAKAIFSNEDKVPMTVCQNMNPGHCLPKTQESTPK